MRVGLVKIKCQCGALIVDQTDYLPHKAHIIPGQEWFGVLDAIDEAVEQSGPDAEDKAKACQAVREVIGRMARLAWQCHKCGRLHVDDQDGQLSEFIPGSVDVSRELFRSRPVPEQ